MPPAGAGLAVAPGGAAGAAAGANPMPPAGAGFAGAPGGAGAAAGAAPGAGFGGVAAGGGFAGAAGPGSTPQTPQSAAGTAEFSAESVVIQALKGDTSNLSEFISPKCRGVLGDIRDGKATEKQIDELKKTFAGIKGVSSKNDAGVKVLTLRNADSSTITFRIKKEGEDYKVIEMSVKAGTAKKGR